jgi:hypothetical protein
MNHVPATRSPLVSGPAAGVLGDFAGDLHGEAVIDEPVANRTGEFMVDRCSPAPDARHHDSAPN